MGERGLLALAEPVTAPEGLLVVLVIVTVVVGGLPHPEAIGGTVVVHRLGGHAVLGAHQGLAPAHSSAVAVAEADDKGGRTALDHECHTFVGGGEEQAVGAPLVFLTEGTSALVLGIGNELMWIITTFFV